MKYIVSLMLGGLLFTSSLTSQILVNTNKVLDQKPVVYSGAEDIVTQVSGREFVIMENAAGDFSSNVWSRDIYRQVGADTEGNEPFFLPVKSSGSEVNLFSLLIRLMSTNAIQIYKYEHQPDISNANKMDAKTALEETVIPYTEINGEYAVSISDIPSDKITHYLVKEKWYFDIKTGKGNIHVTEICPVLAEGGKYFPLFWAHVDDVAPYLARVASSLSVSHVAPALTNVSMFDIIKGRRYRGCIYQVGHRQLSTYFPYMEDMIKERKRIEDELDFIQSRFYAAESRR